jgi:phosphatidylglycerophosphate synthase
MILNDWYQQYKKFSVNFRAKYFKPILEILALLRITPNQITVFRLVFVIPIIFYFALENLTGVIIFYILFWLFDLVDGSLARYLNNQSDKGRFFDTLVDNFMYGVLMIGMIDLQITWLWLLAANILLEYFVQLLAIIYKQWGKPTDYIIKAQADLPYFKSVSHLALLVYYLGLNYLAFIYYLLDLALLATAGYYFYQLFYKLSPKK